MADQEPADGVVFFGAGLVCVIETPPQKIDLDYDTDSPLKYDATPGDNIEVA